MGCPLFLPSSALRDNSGFDGGCASDPGVVIPAETLASCCNRGYARALCLRAEHIVPDAFRFLVKSCSFAGVEIAWSSERDHHPLEVGTLFLSGAMTGGEAPLERQAKACAARIEAKKVQDEAAVKRLRP